MTDRRYIAPASHTAGHLTEDQLDDHLIGDLAPAPSAHLAACPLCTARVAEASQPMASFSAVSLAWGERVSATAPMPSLTASPTPWERRLSWSMALVTCAVALGVTSTSYRFAGSRASAPATTHSIASAPSTDQISSDNQLLNAIDRELADSTESPAALGLLSTGTTTRLQTSDPARDSLRD